MHERSPDIAETSADTEPSPHGHTLTLPLAAARTLHLAAQGLLAPPRRKATKDDVLDAIRCMAQLQIDTIHVVARSPYFVLFSRIGAFEAAWLDAHLAEGRLFEYWSHEACFVPIEDYGLLRHRMLDPAGMGWKYAAGWHAKYRDEIAALLERIRAEGAVRSADFARAEGDKRSGKLASTVTTLLSPFDPVVWDRKRALALFDFDYGIECYLPASRRKYGYFVLPILNRGRLIGRIDAKAHRAQRVFEVKSLHLEPGVRASGRLLTDLRRALQRCADWRGTPEVNIGAAPEGLAAALLAS